MEGVALMWGMRGMRESGVEKETGTGVKRKD